MKIIASLILCILLTPTSLNAGMDITEINQQLNTASIVLKNLSKDLNEGRTSEETFNLEIQKLYIILNSLVLEVKNHFSPQGAVLGASYEPSVFIPSSLPEAIIIFEPVKSGTAKLVTGGSWRKVLSFRIKPKVSDINIQMVELVFDERMWLYAEEISLVATGKVLAKYSPPEYSDFLGLGNDKYALRFSGFSLKVKKDVLRTIDVRIKLKDSIPEEVDAYVYLNNKSVRIIDQSNFFHFLPVDSGGLNGSFSKKFIMERD